MCHSAWDFKKGFIFTLQKLSKAKYGEMWAHWCNKMIN